MYSFGKLEKNLKLGTLMKKIIRQTLHKIESDCEYHACTFYRNYPYRISNAVLVNQKRLFFLHLRAGRYKATSTFQPCFLMISNKKFTIRTTCCIPQKPPTQTIVFLILIETSRKSDFIIIRGF